MEKYEFYISAILRGNCEDYRGLSGINNGRGPNFLLPVTISNQSLPAYEILAQYMQWFT